MPGRVSTTAILVKVTLQILFAKTISSYLPKTVCFNYYCYQTQGGGGWEVRAGNAWQGDGVPAYVPNQVWLPALKRSIKRTKLKVKIRKRSFI